MQEAGRYPNRDRMRRLGLIFLVANLALVGSMVVLSRATADDPVAELPSTELVSGGGDSVVAGSEGTTSPIQGEVEPPRVDARAMPSQRASSGNVDVSNDPVLNELRRAINDPTNGLNFPSIAIPSPLESNPLPPRSAPISEVMRRIESLHLLTEAALSLAREAEQLQLAGQRPQAESLIRRVSELRAMIAQLAVESK